MVYTHLVDFESNDYVCKVVKDVKEATQLIETEFEYVTEMKGINLLRKLK